MWHCSAKAMSGSARKSVDTLCETKGGVLPTGTATRAYWRCDLHRRTATITSATDARHRDQHHRQHHRNTTTTTKTNTTTNATNATNATNINITIILGAPRTLAFMAHLPRQLMIKTGCPKSIDEVGDEST